MKKIYVALFGLLYFLQPALLLSQSAIQTSINTLANDPSLKYGGFSISVVDMATGKLIASHDPKKSLSPASSLKTLTTATALAILGKDFRFRTTLEYDGTLTSDGTLNGNIYIKGYGDPSLGTDNVEGSAGFQAVIEQFRLVIQQKGIRQINGKIIGDASYFDEHIAPASWQWSDLGNYYGAGAWGLNIHENLYYLKFHQSGSVGTTPRIGGVEPAVPGLSFMNEVKTAGRNTGDNAYIYGGPYSYDRIVRGTIPAGSGTFKIKGALPDPAFFAAYHLQEALAMVGIKVEYPAKALHSEDNKASRKVLYTHYSPELSKIVARTNLKSVNLFAEALLKMIGMQEYQEGSIEKGLDAVEAYWESKGLDLGGCFIEDGSGLSRKNSVTTHFLANMMFEMSKMPTVADAFKESLPIAGKSGTLKYRMKGTSAEGRLEAKTGSIARVRSYTGYARSRSTGKKLAFSLIVNNYEGSSSQIRQKMEKVLVALCK